MIAILYAWGGLLLSLASSENMLILLVKGIVLLVDDNDMPLIFRARSNAQRQREFRARNPGYYNKYYAQRKVEWERRMLISQKAHQEKIAAQMIADAAILDPATSGFNVLSEHMV